jgi:hypothetical protein
MKKAIFTILIIMFCLTIAAEEKSVRKAMFYSALLPGTGAAYNNNFNHAAVFWAAEAATIFTYFRLKSERQWALNSYQDFALSMVETPKNSPDWYYQLLQDFKSSDKYNESIIRDARNYFLIYLNDPVAFEEYLEKYLVPEDQAWDWETNRNWYKFRDLRRDKQQYEIYMKFAFAALFLNRFISIIDSAILTRQANKTEHNLGSLQVYPDLVKAGVKIQYEINF